MNVNSILNDTEWEIRHNSRTGLYGDYFVKHLPTKPAIHSFLINNFNSIIRSYTPRFKEFHKVEERKSGITYKYLYLFEKVDIVEIPEYFKEELSKDNIKNILSGSIYVFNKLNKSGFVFHDACWKNICWNKNKDEVCIIDIDSVVKIDGSFKDLGGKGDSPFVTTFRNVEKKYELNDLEFLAVCIVTNMFFSFAVGLYLKNMDATFMMNKGFDRVNEFIENVFENNAVGYDDELYKICKKSIDTLQEYIDKKDIKLIQKLPIYIDEVSSLPNFREHVIAILSEIGLELNRAEVLARKIGIE